MLWCCACECRELEDILNRAWSENVELGQWLCYDEQMIKTVSTFASGLSHYNPMKPITRGEKCCCVQDRDHPDPPACPHQEDLTRKLWRDGTLFFWLFLSYAHVPLGKKQRRLLSPRHFRDTDCTGTRGTNLTKVSGGLSSCVFRNGAATFDVQKIAVSPT